jgi:hypothetical protein
MVEESDTSQRLPKIPKLADNSKHDTGNITPRTWQRIEESFSFALPRAPRRNPFAARTQGSKPERLTGESEHSRARPLCS